MRKRAVRRTKMVKAMDESKGVGRCSLEFVLVFVSEEPFTGPAKMGSGDKSVLCKASSSTGTCSSILLLCIMKLKLLLQLKLQGWRFGEQ